MKANIMVGGLLGIALGAGVVFGLSHGVLPTGSNNVADAPTQRESVDPLSSEGVSSEASVVEVPEGPVRQRPLRPGSARIGHPLQS
jgi:hypothetical protein